MKKIVFLIIASLLVIGLVLPGCGEPAGPEITIAIAGPMKYVQGTHMWSAASMAADEINDAGGIAFGGTNYTLKLLKVDTNEIDNPAAAAPALEHAITVKGAEYIIGGFRTEAVLTMLPVAGANEVPMMICGAATYTLLSGPLPYWTLGGPMSGDGTPYYPYKPSSEDFKYIFRGVPFNDVFLVNNCFMMLAMIAAGIQDELGLAYPWTSGQVRIAIFSESLIWADVMTQTAQDVIGGPLGGYLGWTLANGGTHGDGTWRVTDTQDSVTVSSYLNQIKDPDSTPGTNDGAHIIFTIISGPVGVTYGKLRGELAIPCMSVGINVEGQDPGYWAKTKYATGQYGAESEIGMGTWAPNVVQNVKTTPFLEAYAAYTGGLFPLYTASSYDMVHTFAKAIKASANDADAVVAWLENPINAQLVSTGLSSYYPLWDGTTLGEWKTYFWPALNLTQITAIYGGPSNYDANCNFTMPAYTTHDLVYGPGYVTGLACQWQSGQQIGVWPKAEFAAISNVISRNVAGINWTDIEYAGTEMFVLPAWMVTIWEA